MPTRARVDIFGGRTWPLLGGVALGAILIATSLISNEAPSKPVPDDPILLSHYIGKTVLVGVRELGRDKRPKRQMEWVGRIARLSAEEGIVVELEDGPPCVLPPDLSQLEAATPGEYQLHSSARVVADPDFATTWEYVDHSGTEDRQIAPPSWSPEWYKSYWASRAYRAILAARGWLRASD